MEKLSGTVLKKKKPNNQNPPKIGGRTLFSFRLCRQQCPNSAALWFTASEEGEMFPSCIQLFLLEGSATFLLERSGFAALASADENLTV